MQHPFWLIELQIDNPFDDQFPLARTDLVATDRTVEAKTKCDFGTFVALPANERPGGAVDIVGAIYANTRCDHLSA
jgi:hypothetical protein